VNIQDNLNDFESTNRRVLWESIWPHFYLM